MLVIEAATLRFLDVNEAALAHYGYTREHFLEMTALDIRGPEERPAFSEFMQTFRGSGGAKTWRHLKADGTEILVNVYSTSLLYAGVEARLAAVVDVTERARADAQLLEQKRLMDTAIENMSQGLIMFGTDARLLLCNRRYLDMYGLSPEVVKAGCTLRELLDERSRTGSFSEDPEQYSRTILESVAAGKARSHMAELGERTFHVVSRPMAGGGWVTTHEEITEQKQAEARIHYLAHHDMLTGLPNRAAFNEFVAKALERAAAQHGQLAVISADLDRFQEVNDVFGHAIGDAVLHDLARRFKEASGNAFLARRGGDEFWLVLTEGPQPAAAELLAARLMNVAAEVEIDGQPICSGLSIGISIYPNDGTDAATLLANADAGLNRAKREGRGSVRFFEAQMDQRLRERRALQHELRTAIEHDELRVYYQPQAAIDGRVLGFEALVRWQHPTRGLISPGLFVPLAEETGIIVSIGEWMLRHACREAASWKRPLQIAINLSAGAVPARRPAGSRPFDPARDRARAPPPRARSHRKRADRRLLARCRDPAAAQGAGRADRDGRFRHRLLLAVLFAGISVRQDKDRPGVHFQSRQEPAVGGDRARHHRPGAGPLLAGHRRRRRDRRAARVPGERILRRGPGVSDREAAADRGLCVLDRTDQAQSVGEIARDPRRIPPAVHDRPALRH